MLVLLLILFSWTALCERLLVLVDVSVANMPDSGPLMQNALKRAYHERLMRLAGQGDTISIYQFSSRAEQVLTWTNIFDTTLVDGTIEALDFDNGCLNWEAALREIAQSKTLSPKPTKIIMVVDENPTCASSSSEFATKETARLLQGRGIKIYPIGLGSAVSNQWLKRVAGPCGLFGCKAGIHYLHRKHYHV